MRGFQISFYCIYSSILAFEKNFIFTCKKKIFAFELVDISVKFLRNVFQEQVLLLKEPGTDRKKYWNLREVLNQRMLALGDKNYF